MFRKLLFGIVFLCSWQLDYSQTSVATLFSTEIPAGYDAATSYELGTEFQTLDIGYITNPILNKNP